MFELPWPFVLLALLACTKSFALARPPQKPDGSTTSCRKTVHLKAPSGTLSSPNYPRLYPPNATCTWVIEGRVGQFIRITFISLDVMSDSNCNTTSCKCGDHVHLREPSAAGSARIDENYCNAKKPVGTLTTVGYRLRVVFRSDGFMEGEGFYMRYEILQNRTRATALPPSMSATRRRLGHSSLFANSNSSSTIKESFVTSVSTNPARGGTLKITNIELVPDPTVAAGIAAKRKRSLDEGSSPDVSAKSKANNRTASGGSAKKDEEDPSDLVILGPSLVSVLVFVGGVLGIAYHNYRENEKEKYRYERYERLPYRRPVTGAVIGRNNSKKKQKKNMREIRTHKLYSDMAKEWKDQINIPPRKQANEQSTWDSYMEAKRKKTLGGRLRELAEKPVHFIQTHTPRPSRPTSMVDPDKNLIPHEAMGAKQKSGLLEPGSSGSRPASVLLRDALHMIFAAGLPETQDEQAKTESQPLVHISAENEMCDRQNDNEADSDNNDPITIPAIVVRQPSEDSEYSQGLESPRGTMSERPPKYEDIAKLQRRDPTTSALVSGSTISVEDEPSVPEDKQLSLTTDRPVTHSLDDTPAYTCADHVRDILRESYGDDNLSNSRPWQPGTKSVPDDFAQMVHPHSAATSTTQPLSSKDSGFPQNDHVDDVD